jgi:hypothetical protein
MYRGGHPGTVVATNRLAVKKTVKGPVWSAFKPSKRRPAVAITLAPRTEASALAYKICSLWPSLHSLSLLSPSHSLSCLFLLLVERKPALSLSLWRLSLTPPSVHFVNLIRNLAMISNLTVGRIRKLKSASISGDDSSGVRDFANSLSSRAEIRFGFARFCKIRPLLPSHLRCAAVMKTAYLQWAAAVKGCSATWYRKSKPHNLSHSTTFQVGSTYENLKPALTFMRSPRRSLPHFGAILREIVSRMRSRYSSE